MNNIYLRLSVLVIIITLLHKIAPVPLKYPKTNISKNITEIYHGKVIEDIFNEGSDVGKRKIIFENLSEENKIKQNESDESYSEEEEAEIRQHLKDMGYI